MNTNEVLLNSNTHNSQEVMDDGDDTLRENNKVIYEPNEKSVKK